MPISVSCACGTKITVRDEAAGKLVKCPSCGTIVPVAIPAPGEAAAPAPEGKPTAVAPVQHPLLAGTASRAKCPYCAKSIAVAAVICPHCRQGLKTGAPGKGKICPSCGFNNPAHLETCGSCAADIRTVAVSQRSGLVADVQAPARVERESSPVHVEVYVALGLIAIIALGSLKGTNIVGMALWAIIFIGVLQRKNWGWWMAVVFSGLGLLGCVILLAEPPKIEGVHIPPEAFLIGIVLCVVLIGLLVSARVRDAYFKDD